jgi:allantoate deiminase
MTAPSIVIDPAVSERLHQRIDTLAAYSEEDDCLTRTVFSEAMQSARQSLHQWMESAGMQVTVDPLGNIAGRTPGTTSTRRLLIGSHLDTVRNAGKYDGALGVLLGLACVEQLSACGIAVPFPIEVVGFADEEGWKYQTPYLGSSTVMGDFQPEWLARKDETGTTLQDALEASGVSADHLGRNRDPVSAYWAYLEAHIEQGPVLETADCAVGVVRFIAGQTRASVTFTGRAGHAGTTPMALRHDALPAAASWIGAVEEHGRSIQNLVATVGRLHVEPNVSNVIPAKVELTLDLRHPDNEVRLTAVQHLHDIAINIANGRSISAEWILTQDQPAMACDEKLCAALQTAASTQNPRAPMLISGAGHDAVAVSQHLPVGMLFLRCRDGLSHHPDEYAHPSDIDSCLAVMVDFLRRSAESRLYDEF